MGTLYLVATPIGNLEDITQRALRVLREVSLIAAEDTRHTRKLLSHYGIQTPLTSYHEHNKIHKLDTILSRLQDGDVALVSDAGTPALNDPGYELVQAILDASFNISPIPGPSAPIAALTVSGLPTDAFLYLGYLPRKPTKRCKDIQSVTELAYTLVFLSPPHRLMEELKDLREILGDRQVAVARELTKIYEEVFRGALSEAVAHYNANPPRGEITLVVAGKGEVDRWTKEQVLSAIKDCQNGDETPSQLARRVAEESGWGRREVYQLILGTSGDCD